MQRQRRNPSIKSSLSVDSTPDIVSPLTKLENVNNDQRRISLISQDSVVTTGRLLDKLGLDDMDESEEDGDFIDEHSVSDFSFIGGDDTNYAPADRFRSLNQANTANKLLALNGNNSAAQVAMSIGSVIHSVTATKLITEASVSSPNRNSFQGQLGSADIDEFSLHPSNSTLRHSVSIRLNDADDSDDDVNSFEYGDDKESINYSLTEQLTQVTSQETEHTFSKQHTKPAPINVDLSSFDVQHDVDKIYVNPSFKQQETQTKKSYLKSFHSHSLSNPSDMVSSTSKKTRNFPKSPLTKIFHDKFYHITAPNLVATNPDDSPLKSPSSSLFSKSPTGSKLKAIHGSINPNSISSPIPTPPPPRFNNLTSDMQRAFHVRTASSDGTLRDLPEHLMSHKVSSSVDFSTMKPLLTTSPSAPSIASIKHNFEKADANDTNSNHDNGQNDNDHFEVAPRSFTAPSTFNTEKVSDDSNPKVFINPSSKSFDLVLEPMPTPAASPSLQTPSPRRRHPYSQIKLGEVSSPSIPAFKKISKQPSMETIRAMSPPLTARDPSFSDEQVGAESRSSSISESSTIAEPTSISSSKSLTNNTEHSVRQYSSTLTPEARVSMAIALRKSGQSKDAACQLEIAANQGNKDAMLLYGLSLRYGYGLKKNEKESFYWICKAGDITPYKPYRFNIDPYRLEVEKKGDEDIPKEYHTLASTMFEIGQAYMYGWGIERDELQGIEFVEMSASLGYVDAMCECGTFWNKKGASNRKKNMKRAASWFRLSETFGAKLIGSSWIHKSKYLS